MMIMIIGINSDKCFIKKKLFYLDDENFIKSSFLLTILNYTL